MGEVARRVERGDDHRARAVDLDRAVGHAERLGDVGRGEVRLDRVRRAQIGALVLLRVRALRDRDGREVVFGLAGLDQEAPRPQRDVVHVGGEAHRVPEVGRRAGRAVGADARAAAAVERPVHDDVAGEAEVHRHRRLGHEVAGRLAAEVEVEQPVAAGHAERGGDGLRGHRVLEEPEAGRHRRRRRGASPASSIARAHASVARSSTLRPEAFVSSV